MNIRSILSAALVALMLTACLDSEDPGPIQEITREYDLEGFTSVEAGDAIVVSIVFGDEFQVTARGDRRNIEDLWLRKDGEILEIDFTHSRNRRHTTYVDISMPSINHVDISGASIAFISGFSQDGPLGLNISGASLCDLKADVGSVHAVVSGASIVRAWGSAESLEANLSGASLLNAFHFPVLDASIVATGASSVEVSVETSLTALATGASQIVYKGDPVVDADVSGASVVRRD